MNLKLAERDLKNFKHGKKGYVIPTKSFF